jgi:cyanophycin synthetase
VANALAAVAAGRAAGVSAKDIRRALAAFAPEAANPGRGNVFRAGNSPVIVDYGHNAAALEATGQFITEVFGGEPVAAVTLPGDRRDDLLAQSAEAIAARFGAVVLYEDSDKRGRAQGEMHALIGTALRQARPGIRCEDAENPADALRAALEIADGNPVLFLYEKLGLAYDALTAAGAVPWLPPDPDGTDDTGSGRGTPVPSPVKITVSAAASLQASQPADKPFGADKSLDAGQVATAADLLSLPDAVPGDASADYGIVCGCEPSGS